LLGSPSPVGETIVGDRLKGGSGGEGAGDIVFGGFIAVGDAVGEDVVGDGVTTKTKEFKVVSPDL
jgi:hypothetical protein